MYQIAIIEDMEHDYRRLEAFLQHYQQDNGETLQFTWIHSAEEFLENYQSQYDIVFMDIQLEGMDGMKAAHKLREKDETVILVFLTSLAQYAVQGYEVDALDYIVKPVTYPALELKLRKALSRCQKNTSEVLISIGTEKTRVEANRLIYVEIFEHHLQYKTSTNVIKGYGTLKDVEKNLPKTGFFRLNNQTIVNLRHVKHISGNTAEVGDRVFDISRMRKKDFLAEFHRYGLNG